MNPGKLAQLGAHYTSKKDVSLIVEPVSIAPLERRWHQVRSEADALAAKVQEARGAVYNKLRAQLQERLFGSVEESSKVHILDPACGSGNFLYVALAASGPLERALLTRCRASHIPTFLPPQVTPGAALPTGNERLCAELDCVVVWMVIFGGS